MYSSMDVHSTPFLDSSLAICIALRFTIYSQTKIVNFLKDSKPILKSVVNFSASCTMGTWPFPGVKQPGRVIDHPPPSSDEVKERVEKYLYSPSGPSWPVLG
jgi:hypothetical protein